MRNVSWLAVVAVALVVGAAVVAVVALAFGEGVVTNGDAIIVVAIAGVAAAVLSLRD